MDGTEFTIFFEDPFWVGVLVADRGDCRFVARVVFGAEPTNAELLLFMRERFSRLAATARPVPLTEVSAERYIGSVSAKRGSRASAREQKRGPGKAVAAAHAAFELSKAEARIDKGQERQSNCERRFALRVEKKKASKRGK
jgi:hypothetical protein